MAKSDFPARAFEFAGKTIAGKTTSKRGTKLVQYAAAREWANKNWASAYRLYREIPEKQRSVAVLERLLVLVDKLDLGEEKESISSAFVADYRSMAELAEGLTIAKNLKEPELQAMIIQKLGEGLAAQSGYTPELFATIHGRDPAWRRLEVLSARSGKACDDAKWLELTAGAAWELKDYELVLSTLESISEKKKKTPKLKYIEAECYRRLDDIDSARNAYKEYLKLFPKGKEFQSAVKQIRRSDGDLVAYEVISSGLLGDEGSDIAVAEMANLKERLHAYPEATELYSEGAFSNSHDARMSYKVGLNAERDGDLELSVLAYKDALRKQGNPRGHWYSYRLASAYYGLDRYADAMRAYADYFKIKPSAKQDQWGFERIVTNLFKGKSHRELQELVRYRVSKGSHSNESIQLNYGFLPLGPSPVRFALAESAVRKGPYQVAADILKGGETFANKDGMNPDSYRKSTANKRNTYYVECMRQCEINERLILWESNHGSSVGCHPLALFRDFVATHPEGEFVHVWAVNDLTAVPNDVKANPDVVLVPLHSRDYLFALATAKYLVNNVTFAPYFVRREEQLYLNTWHGTPYKTLGKSMKQGILEYENIQRNFIQSTHLLAPNELTRWSLVDDHGIDDVYSGKVLLGGSPRLDTSLNQNQEQRLEMRKKLGVYEEQQKVVLYAPTWRGGVSDRELDVDELIADLKALDAAGIAKVVFRAHRLSEKLLQGIDIPVTVVPSEIDTNELLGAVDVLVTDYSSILFDFLPQKKPVVLYQHDFEDYKAQRGLYLEDGEVPGAKVYDRQDLSSAVSAALAGEYAPDPRDLDRYCPYEDGNASSRINAAFFEDKFNSAEELIDYSDVQAEKSTKSIVWHASLIPNGIASAGLALLDRIPADDFVVNFIVEPRTLRNNPDRFEQFRKLPNNVRVICRSVVLPRSIEMMRDVATFKKIDCFPNDEFAESYFKAFDLERRRIFSDFKPDYVVEYDGYADFWLSLLSSWGRVGAETVCYQHNQMFEEMVRKDPTLNRTFALYPFFDQLIAVSEALSGHNERTLARFIEGTPVQQTFARNLVNLEAIQELAQRTFDDEAILEFMGRFETTFVSVGRLSPEKNQSELLSAVAELKQQGIDVGLVLVGSGILEDQLHQKIIHENLSDRVLMTGQLSNPYPVIKNADCFVLPSRHEGQPVTLLEAMALGVPVITTKLPGCVEVVSLGYGDLIDFDASSIAAAMARFIEDPKVASGTFDGEAYCSRVLAENVKAVCGN